MPAVSAMTRNVTTQLNMTPTSANTFCFDISATDLAAHRLQK
jgi:hypothetical protein